MQNMLIAFMLLTAFHFTIISSHRQVHTREYNAHNLGTAKKKKYRTQTQMNSMGIKFQNEKLFSLQISFCLIADIKN